MDPSPEWIEEIRASMPVLPAQIRTSLIQEGADPDVAATVIARGLGSLVAATIAAGADAKKTLTHAQNNLDPDAVGVLDASRFAELVTMETDGKLTATQAKSVLLELTERGGSAAEIAASLGFEAMEVGELEALLDQIIAESPDEWQRFCEGETKLQGFFTGQIMKATKGQADGKAINQLLTAKKS